MTAAAGHPDDGLDVVEQYHAKRRLSPAEVLAELDVIRADTAAYDAAQVGDSLEAVRERMTQRLDLAQRERRAWERLDVAPSYDGGGVRALLRRAAGTLAGHAAAREIEIRTHLINFDAVLADIDPALTAEQEGDRG